MTLWGSVLVCQEFPGMLRLQKNTYSVECTSCARSTFSESSKDGQSGEGQTPSLFLTLVNAWGVKSSSFIFLHRIFSTTVYPVDLRPVCKLEFVHCGPVEKKQSALSASVQLWRSEKVRGHTFPNHHPRSENHNFSTTKHPSDLRPVCKFEFVRCGPVEKKIERSICLGLIITV